MLHWMAVGGVPETDRVEAGSCYESLNLMHPFFWKWVKT